MAENTNPKIKFGVVHGTPSQLTADKIEEGKLYFLSGEESDGIKQGIYGVDPLATGDYKTLALFGTGAVANGVGYGLSQYNFDSSYKDKLDGIAEGAGKYSTGKGLVLEGTVFSHADTNTNITADTSYVQIHLM